MRRITNLTKDDVYVAGIKVGAHSFFDMEDDDYYAHATDWTRMAAAGIISVAAWSADDTDPSADEVTASYARNANSYARAAVLDAPTPSIARRAESLAVVDNSIANRAEDEASEARSEADLNYTYISIAASNATLYSEAMSEATALLDSKATLALSLARA